MTDSMRERLDDLFDADRSEFDSEEDYRDYIDGQIARLDMLIDETESDLGAVDARTDALSRMLAVVDERARRAERLAAWGGIGYDGRIERVVSTLIREAREDPTSTSSWRGREIRYVSSISPQEIRSLLDESVSIQTCRSYVRDLSGCPGFGLREAKRGGFEGGSDPMRLGLDLERFVERYGSEWSVEEIIEDMEVEEP